MSRKGPRHLPPRKLQSVVPVHSQQGQNISSKLDCGEGAQVATLGSLGCDKVLGLAFPSLETKVAEDTISLLTKEFDSNTGSLHHECPDNADETVTLAADVGFATELAANSRASKVLVPLEQQTLVRLDTDSVTEFGLGCDPW